MKKLLYTAFAALALTFSATNLRAQNPNAAPSPTIPATISNQLAVVVLKEAQPCLMTELNCNLPLGFLVSRYHQGQLQIETLGTWDGKNWFRVTYDGGQVTLGLLDAL